MRIGGLQKTSVIDFPGRLACTVFTVGCNFVCPFCHNKSLVDGKGIELIDENYFFEFLKKRKNILEGVCITGGEPTLQVELADFCRKIKAMGLAVKLDTNGSRPEVLEKLLAGGFLDMVAMDVKNCFSKYRKTIQVESQKFKVESWVKKSIKMILESGLEYEFRTTVVPRMHNGDSLIQLAEELKELGGKETIWVLQKFRANENCLDKRYRKMKSFSDEEMEGFLRGAREVLPKTTLRE